MIVYVQAAIIIALFFAYVLRRVEVGRSVFIQWINSTLTDRKQRNRVDNGLEASARASESQSGNTSTEKSTDKALSEGSSSPKKHSRRQKKKRNTNKAKFKTTDDSSDTSSNSDLSAKSSYIPPEKTTIYSPLPLYQDINLDMFSLYYEFHKCRLTESQLASNGYPADSPSRPGRVILYNKKSLLKTSNSRECVRCGKDFHLHADGTYKPENSTCRYHTRKQQYTEYRSDFPCCGGNYMSLGCKTWQYHVTVESALQNIPFVKTKNKRHTKKGRSCSVYALDCEMVYTTAGFEVAKVGVVSIEGLTVFESFVLPQNQILDYNTQYSGISEKDLKGVTMTLADLHAFLLNLLSEDSILVGHALDNDFRAMRFIHRNVVDTSVAYPHARAGWKKSLRSLAEEHLGKKIQTSSNGHNCIEDARTSLELMLLKIKKELNSRPPIVQDENRNSILQNTSRALPVTRPANYYRNAANPSPSNYRYCSNSYRGEQFYSGLLTPNNHQNNVIY